MYSELVLNRTQELQTSNPLESQNLRFFQSSIKTWLETLPSQGSTTTKTNLWTHPNLLKSSKFRTYVNLDLGLTPTLQWNVVVASIALCNKNWKSRVCGHLFNHFPCKSLFRKTFLKKHVQMFRYSSTFKRFEVQFWVGKPELKWVWILTFQVRKLYYSGLIQKLLIFFCIRLHLHKCMTPMSVKNLPYLHILRFWWVVWLE